MTEQVDYDVERKLIRWIIIIINIYLFSAQRVLTHPVHNHWKTLVYKFGIENSHVQL